MSSAHACQKAYNDSAPVFQDKIVPHEFIGTIIKVPSSQQALQCKSRGDEIMLTSASGIR